MLNLRNTHKPEVEKPLKSPDSLVSAEAEKAKAQIPPQAREQTQEPAQPQAQEAPQPGSLDLRNAPESAHPVLTANLTAQQKSAKRLAESLEQQTQKKIDAIASEPYTPGVTPPPKNPEIRAKTMGGVTVMNRRTSPVLDFLLNKDYLFDFLELLKLNQTKVHPENKKSSLTKLSQKVFLQYIKAFKPENEKLQKVTQPMFYKWLCRNGLGTKEQITKYYVSRSKEIANVTKRKVMIKELIGGLGTNPALIKKLFSFPEFTAQLDKYFDNKLSQK